MIEVKKFFNFLNRKKIDFFTGVPDSVLKDTKNYFENKKTKNHLVVANEGLAVATCIGYYLSSKRIPCMYMQNSGLGNAINPLSSIAHPNVYSIPMLILIGWRGANNEKDEPQHKVKGKITKKILQLLGIKYCVISKTRDLIKLGKLINYSKKKNVPVACLIKKNILKSKIDVKKKASSNKNQISRELFISKLITRLKNNTKIISTTGYTSRELYQIRKNKKNNNGKDFYMVGGMGHTSTVAFAVSLINTKSQIICLDGDGSFLMHMGSIINIGKFADKNFKHILLNNNIHESVGGQKSNIDKVNLKKLILAAGYKNFFKIDKKVHLEKNLSKFMNSAGPSFLEVKIKQGAIKNLQRPKNLLDIKKNFMKS
ncbi:MAG: phosphonopyruvate decarboxylase [Pelagibacteraceae bacterium TMED216]|nr:MAG: phosphonopyruvate decarboxylase [Pelagibacteraceae bacterium TMED216]|tara:strand:- start:6766 stop:7878 length:1113 start_codon:yes stop_codon:yes gene_type:complete